MTEDQWNDRLDAILDDTGLNYYDSMSDWDYEPDRKNGLTPEEAVISALNANTNNWMMVDYFRAELIGGEA